jgi:hypothetical protein
MFETRILEAFGSNLDQITDYLERFSLVVFHSSSKQMPGWYVSYATATSFHILSSSVILPFDAV